MNKPDIDGNPCFERRLSGRASSIQFIDDDGIIDLVAINTFKVAKYAPSHGILALSFGTTQATLRGHGLDKIIKPLLIDCTIDTVRSFYTHDQERDFNVWVKLHNVYSPVEEKIEDYIKYLDGDES